VYDKARHNPDALITIMEGFCALWYLYAPINLVLSALLCVKIRGYIHQFVSQYFVS